jgi:sialate O-acetylesterase
MKSTQLIQPILPGRSLLAGFLNPVLAWVMVILISGAGANAAEARKGMPKQDVVEFPAIAPGLCVSNAFQTNMVLQRDKALHIWGWAAAAEKVTVSLAGQEESATAGADRSWQVTLKPMASNSTPQAMTVKGNSETLSLENILVGDVWILGGQSNMEFPISNVDDGQLEIVSANFPQIRLLTMPSGKGFNSVHSFERLHEWSDWSKRHFRRGDWDVCSPETVKEFSAIGYVFGRRVFMATQVPIGLIDASIGGTTVETWTPDEVIRKVDGKETRDMLKGWDDKIAAFDPKADLEQRLANYNKNIEKMKAKSETPATDLRPGPAGDKNRPGNCFAGIIRPLNGLAAKGAVFHQGFNNCFSGSAGARMYYQVFGNMITAWRGNFGDPQMPFCIISLGTAGEPQKDGNYLRSMFDVGPLIRESQYKTFLDFSKAGDKAIGYASSFDQRKSFYHPQIKIPVGERVAKWALASQYALLKGDEFWLPPAITGSEAVDSTIKLTMSTDVTRKDDSEDKMVGFAIAGEDRRFYPADTEYFSDGTKDNRNRPVVSKKMLVLSSPFVPKPAHYRYAWARNPLANITSNRQIPLATQRSDEWLMEETPVIFPTAPEMSESDAARFRQNKVRKELELDDTARGIAVAEATVAELKDKFAKDKESWEKQKAADAEKLKVAK